MTKINNINRRKFLELFGSCTCGLVITTCTSIAHLSASIGTKTWILLAYNSDWRWFTNTNFTPWYKNTLLFRQDKLNDWESVFEKVKQKLILDYKS